MNPAEQPSITCPRCRRTSWHPEDVRQGYCGACHAFTSPSGGVAPGYVPGGRDSIRAFLSPGEEITDPRRAEQLGLTVEARRLRERANARTHIGQVLRDVQAGEVFTSPDFAPAELTAAEALPAGSRIAVGPDGRAWLMRWSDDPGQSGSGR